MGSPLDALTTSQPMVGGPLNVARITPDGVRHLDADAIEGLRAQVERWEDADQRTLDPLFEGNP